MPADECKDCEAHFPGGEGLIDGRCPSCDAYFREARQREEPAAPTETPEEGEEK